MIRSNSVYRKIIRQIGIGAGITMLPFLLSAQQHVPRLSLTLARVRDLAIKNNPQLAADILDAHLFKEMTAEARLKKIPQVYADMNLQRNLIIPVTPVPSNAFNPNAPEGQLTPLRFTTKWTANAGLNANIDLFNPQKRLAVQEATVKEKITDLQNKNNADHISADVSEAYISALIAFEQLGLAAADTARKAGILKISEQQFGEGRLLLATLNQLKADRNTALNSFEEAQKIYSDSKEQLLYTIGYDPEIPVEIEFTDGLDGLFQQYQKSTDTLSREGFAKRKLTQNEILLDYQIAALLKGYLPSLAIKAYYGGNYFDNNFEIFKGSSWNGNSFVNLGVRMPITEGLDRQKKIKQLKLQKQADALRYKDERNKNNLAYLAAMREAGVFEKNFLRTLENLKLAEENLKLAEQQFADGRLLIAELHQLGYQFQLEKHNYLQLAYSYISARLRMEKLSKD